MTRRRLGMAIALLGAIACGPPPHVEEATGTDERVAAPSATTSAPSSPRELNGHPYVLRCADRHTGCQLTVRIRRDNGAIEPLGAFGGARDPQPVLVDDARFYLPGRAASKRDLGPFELAWRTHRLRDLDQADEVLVVVDAQGVYLLPKDGSARRELVDDEHIWAAAVGPFVAWGVSELGPAQRHALVLADHAGTPFRRFDDARPGDLAFDGDALYWFDRSPDHPAARLLVLKDGEVTVLADELEMPSALAFDADWIYWVSPTEEGRILWRLRRRGGQPERVSISHGLHGRRGNEEHVAVNGDHVYWNAAQSVVRAPKTGGPAEIVATVDFHGDVHNFALDDTHLYVTAEIYRTREPR